MSQQFRSIGHVEEFARRARAFEGMRQRMPTEPAHRILRYLKDDDNPGLSYKQYYCRHEWSSGFDDSDHECAIYCMRCGADGDA